MHGPLHGVTVAVTRPIHQAEVLAGALREHGAQVLVVPLLEIVVDHHGMAELRRHLHLGSGAPEVVVVTSPNGARCLADTWQHTPVESSQQQPLVVVVGPGTAQALREAGGPPVTAMATTHVAEGIIDLMGEGTRRVLVAQGDLARPALVDGLRSRGWEVTAVTVYRTLARVPSSTEGAQLLESDLVTLASASAARSWSAWLAGRRSPAVVVMGPVTEREARRLHLEVVGVADPHTLEGLVEATVRSVPHRRRGGTTPAS